MLNIEELFIIFINNAYSTFFYEEQRINMYNINFKTEKKNLEFIYNSYRF